MSKTEADIEKALETKIFEVVGWIKHDPTLEGRIIATQLLKAAILEAIRDMLVLESHHDRS